MSVFGRVKGQLEKLVFLLLSPILRVLLETKQFVHLPEEDASPFFANLSESPVEIVLGGILDLDLQEVVAGQLAVEEHITL